MNDPNYQHDLQNQIARKGKRRLRAQADQRSVWYGLGMFGLVGWSIAVPTVLGIFVGLWLDRHWEHPASFTLTGMLVGLLSGIWVAWYWVRRESQFDDGDGSPEEGESQRDSRTESPQKRTDDPPEVSR